LPAANVAAFDTELEAITRAPVVDLAALDEFLSGWWRIANRQHVRLGRRRGWGRPFRGSRHSLGALSDLATSAPMLVIYVLLYMTNTSGVAHERDADRHR
jgi:hypothetical protein